MFPLEFILTQMRSVSKINESVLLVPDRISQVFYFITDRSLTSIELYARQQAIWWDPYEGLVCFLPLDLTVTS